jgi:undecaprenyl-diphosphatase
MKKGVLIGCAQALALIPGVSRSGITITTGLFMGLSRVEAARFSFLLAIPIIAGSAAGTYLDNQNSVVFDAPLLVGLIAAFVSGLLAIKFLLHAIGRFGLKPFAYYRLALAFIVLLILL